VLLHLSTVVFGTLAELYKAYHQELSSFPPEFMGAHMSMYTYIFNGNIVFHKNRDWQCSWTEWWGSHLDPKWKDKEVG